MQRRTDKLLLLLMFSSHRFAISFTRPGLYLLAGFTTSNVYQRRCKYSSPADHKVFSFSPIAYATEAKSINPLLSQEALPLFFDIKAADVQPGIKSCLDDTKVTFQLLQYLFLKLFS